MQCRLHDGIARYVDQIIRFLRVSLEEFCCHQNFIEIDQLRQ